MSQSGIFRLVLRDERFDQFFTASDFLRKRFAEIRARRAGAGLANPQPTFADLAQSHLFHLRSTYRPFVAVASEYVRVMPSGDCAALTEAGGSVEFTFPTFGHFVSDMAFRVSFGDVGPAPGLKFRFCAYPGIRLFKKVSFLSDETLIDDYTSDDVAFVDKFAVPADRRAAWDRGMGQGDLRTVEFENPPITQVVHYRQGPQTPAEFYKSGLLNFTDLWIPLQFWMCKDAANALPNDLIPNSQRKVTANLAKLSEIIQAVDANGEVVPLPFTKLALNIDLYVNHLFVNPEVHDLFASRVGHTLIRVHRRQVVSLNKEADSILLNQLKYPAEFLFVGFRNKIHLSDFDQWHLMGVNVAKFAERLTDNPGEKLIVRNQFAFPLVNAGLDGGGNLEFTSTVGVGRFTGTLMPAVKGLQFTAHGIDLFPKVSANFFSDYLPQRYFGKTCVTSSRDTSAYMAAFCLFPGKSDPSGYYNLSAGREFYLSYESARTMNFANRAVPVISSGSPAELVVSMSALNFLVRIGDKVHLRYSL